MTATLRQHREQWLNRVAAELLPEFKKLGSTDYPPFRVSCGFPSTGKRPVTRKKASTPTL